MAVQAGKCRKSERGLGGGDIDTHIRVATRIVVGTSKHHSAPAPRPSGEVSEDCLSYRRSAPTAEGRSPAQPPFLQRGGVEGGAVSDNLKWLRNQASMYQGMDSGDRSVNRGNELHANCLTAAADELESLRRLADDLIKLLDGADCKMALLIARAKYLREQES